MELTNTRGAVPLAIWMESVGSTNAELRERAAREALPHGTVLATADQTSGRGRLSREWITPPGTALAVSVLVRDFGEKGLGPSWLPLLAGSAVTAALQPLFGEGVRVGVKWPNDVHVRDEEDAEAGRTGPKLCGILCEMLPDGSIVVGMGINLLVPEWELPTDRATSVLAAGGAVGGAETIADPLGEALADRVIAQLATGLMALAQLAVDKPEAARARVLRNSLTLGSEVRVHLPGGELVDGRARALDDTGALVVDLPTGGQLTVNAADIEHLR